MSSDIQSNDLFNAAKSQLPKWAETLLKEEGFDPNAKDEKGNTPLFYAADVGDIQAIGYSLSPNALDTLRVLIENGANPDITNDYGETVLEIARSLVTAGGEYNTWLTLASILYGNNTPLFKVMVAKVEKEFDPNRIFKDKVPKGEFPTFPNEKNTSNTQKENTKNALEKESLLVSAIIGFCFLLSPLLTLYFTWSDLFGLSSEWLWIDNSIVGITLLLCASTIAIILKEKKYHRLILFFLPSFLACIVYFALIIAFFQPEVRYKVKKNFYMKSAFQSQVKNPWVQNGFYEDFFHDKSGLLMRKDEELIIQLALGLKPNEQRSEIGKGFGAETYAKQGFTVYVSYREMGLSPKEIFDRPEAIWLLYALALAESNPDLLEITKIPEEFLVKYISFSPNKRFPLGILDDAKMNFFYDLIVRNISNASQTETELAIFILTQIPVDLNDDSFASILKHWIGYKIAYEKEIRYLMNLRKELRKIFFKTANGNKLIKVNIDNSSGEQSNFHLVKPFLISTGFSIESGEDINLAFFLESEFLKDKKVYRTKPIQKTRTVSRTVSNYGSPINYRTETKTETYTEYISDGFDIIPMYVYSYAFPGILPAEETVKLCGILADCYLNSEKKTTLPLENYLRGETWIYALPKNLVCKTGCDGR
jgi:hypothetical protein